MLQFQYCYIMCKSFSVVVNVLKHFTSHDTYWVSHWMGRKIPGDNLERVHWDDKLGPPQTWSLLEETMGGC